MSLKGRNFLTLKDFTKAEINEFLEAEEVVEQADAIGVKMSH